LGDGVSTSVAEGGTFVVWVTMDRPSSRDTTVTISVQAAGGAEYIILPNHRFPDKGAFET